MNAFRSGVFLLGISTVAFSGCQSAPYYAPYGQTYAAPQYYGGCPPGYAPVNSAAGYQSVAQPSPGYGYTVAPPAMTYSQGANNWQTVSPSGSLSTVSPTVAPPATTSGATIAPPAASTYPPTYPQGM